MKDSIEKLGSINADEQSVIIVTDGYSQVGIQITGTWAGTLEFEGTINGDTWFSLDATPVPSTTSVNNTTANGAWIAQCPGTILVRVRCSTYTSGSPRVFMRAIAAGGGGGASGGGASVTDGEAFTANTSTGTPAMGVYQSSPDTLTDNDLGIPLLTADRHQVVDIGASLSPTAHAVGVRPDDYAVDDSAMPATPRTLPVGGEYRPGANDYASGDVVVQQFNSVGALMNAGIDNFYVTKCAPTAFDGATTNARGDEGGTNDPFTLFTVTGDVLMAVYGVCTTDLTGSGLVSVGPTGNTTLMMAALLATSIDQHEVWMDATPAIGKTIDGLTFYVIGNGVDIVEDITTDTVTAGNIYYIALWKPLSPGSSVVSAV